jgi:hypothetical protein
MAKKSVFDGGASQNYERCVGSACKGKDTPARKLMGVNVLDESGGRIMFHPVCKDCESTAKLNAVARRLPDPNFQPLTKENAYVYREQLDAEAAEQYKNLNAKQRGIAAPNKELSKKVINPDSHGRMEHVYFARDSFEMEPKKAGTGGQEKIGQRPKQQVGTAAKVKKLSEQEKALALEKEAASYDLGRDKGPWTPLTPRTTKSGKKSSRLRRRDTWEGNPDPGIRRPTKETGELWKSPEKIISVYNAKIRAADPSGAFSLASILGQGDSTSLPEHLKNVEKAYTERALFTANLAKEERVRRSPAVDLEEGSAPRAKKKRQK